MVFYSGNIQVSDIYMYALIFVGVSMYVCRYRPTWLWGKSGHIQTLLFGAMQKPHKVVPMSEGKQYFLSLKDTSLVSFHVYEPLKPHQTG